MKELLIVLIIGGYFSLRINLLMDVGTSHICQQPNQAHNTHQYPKKDCIDLKYTDICSIVFILFYFF